MPTEGKERPKPLCSPGDAASWIDYRQLIEVQPVFLLRSISNLSVAQHRAGLVDKASESVNEAIKYGGYEFAIGRNKRETRS